MSMRMAVKTSGEKQQVPEKPEIHGRLKSDITENKEKIYLEQQGDLFTLKMWVPREQGQYFQGQA